jgi:hypothetical protein
LPRRWAGSAQDVEVAFDGYGLSCYARGHGGRAAIEVHLAPVAREIIEQAAGMLAVRQGSVKSVGPDGPARSMTAARWVRRS